MEQLIELLNMVIEKYNVSPEDVQMLDEAINSIGDEFDYEVSDISEEPVEEPIDEED